MAKGRGLGSTDVSLFMREDDCQVGVCHVVGRGGMKEREASRLLLEMR